MRDALKPFADCANYIERHMRSLADDDETGLWLPSSTTMKGLPSIRMKDVRRAREALKELSHPGLKVVHGPRKLSKAAQERTWKWFMGGGTSHSALALTLSYIIERCEREKVPYTLDAHPGLGYFIKPLEEM